MRPTAHQSWRITAVALNNKTREKGYIDYNLIFIILLLIGFGLLMVYSTSSYEASMSTLLKNDPGYYFKKQLRASIMGIGAMTLVSFIPYHFWEKFGLIAYGVAMFLVVLVLTPLGYEANGARRWLNLGISVQPAEIAKVAMILFLAGFVTAMGNSIKTNKGFWVVLLSPGFMCLAVWLITDNMSSAIIIFAIALIMLFVASNEYKKFVIFGAIAAVGTAALVLLIKLTEGSDVFGFRGARIRAWLDPEAYASTYSFQTTQALYAIGSGGVFGKGIGQSTQKLGFLPEAQNDMIFSIICEELGVFGGVCIIALFLLLLWRLLIIAMNAPDLYGSLIVVGVMGHIAVQVILNIAVVTGVIPNTGISLPFISYGGSSVMFLLIEFGLVTSVSKSIIFEN
ncbi:MAG: putative lipid II flippase FtsW [Lachnospiraceae bacterium]|nr:putative lipid II flippase FtsW [Lachnospiraceae bacterium]